MLEKVRYFARRSPVRQLLLGLLLPQNEKNAGFHFYSSADKTLGKPEKLTSRVSAYVCM